MPARAHGCAVFSPADSLSIDDIFKTQGYACFSKALRTWGKFAGDGQDVLVPARGQDVPSFAPATS